MGSRGLEQPFHRSGLFRVIDVDQPRLLQPLAHLVHVEGKLARSETLALAVFIVLAFLRLLRGLNYAFLWDDHHAIVVGHDQVAWFDAHSRAHNRNVHRAERRFDRALGGYRLRPHRETHLLERLHVAAAGVDHQADHPARDQRGLQQYAEHAVGVVGGAADHQHVALLALLDRDVDHPVVARLRQHRYRRPADRGARPDRSHVRLHQAASPERFVRGGDADAGEGADGVRISTFDVADDDGLHFFLTDYFNSNSTVGNSR